MKKQKAFRHSRTAWAASALRCAGYTASILFVTALTAVAAPSKGEQFQRMNYEVYAGGINAVSAKLDVDMKPDNRYSLVLSAYTKGFLGALAPWDGTFETHGWQSKEGLDQPELHRSTAVWRDEEEVKEYSFNRKGEFTSYMIKDPDHAEGKTELPDPELVQGTVDILTATLQVMKEIGRGETCEGVSEIFDGERRFRLKFKFEANEDLLATRYNVYEGPSQRCVVEIEPVAGKWHEKPRGWLSIQEQGRQKGSLPTVWFAKLREDGPAVPIKIRVKTEYGGMFMHLVNYDNGKSYMTADVVSEEQQN